MIATESLHRYLSKLGLLFSSAMRTVRLFHFLKLASALFTQLASLYLVYVLTPAEYGQFALIASVAQLMYILSSGWSNGSVINLGSQSFAQTGSYKSVVYYRICIVVVALVTVSLLFGAFKTLIEGYMKIGGMFPYVLVLFLGYVFYDHASQLLYPGNRDRTQALAEFTATFVLLMVVVFLVKDLKSYILTYSVVSIVFACIVSILFLRYYWHQQFQWRRTEFASILNYSAWQIISIISIYTVNMGTNYILVICDIPLEQIGLYNFAYRLYSGFAPFFSLFGILIPKWIHSSSAGIRLIEKRLLIIVSILAAIYLISGLLMTPILQKFNMHRYIVSVEYFFWLFPAFLFMSYTNLLNTVIANTERYRSAQTGILVQSGLLALIAFPLVSVFGVGGAIVAVTAASAAGAMYFNWNYRRMLNQIRR